MFLDELIRQPDLSWHLVNQRTDQTLATRVLTAFDSRSRKKGLLGRAALESGSALIIAPCNGIHTWFMRFAIDVVFVTKTGQILKVQHALRPWRLAWATRAFAAIELPAGIAAGLDTVPGDRLALTRGSGPIPGRENSA